MISLFITVNDAIIRFSVQLVRTAKSLLKLWFITIIMFNITIHVQLAVTSNITGNKPSIRPTIKTVCEQLLSFYCLKKKCPGK